MPDKLQRAARIRSRAVITFVSRNSLKHAQSGRVFLSERGHKHGQKECSLFRSHREPPSSGFQRRIGLRAAATSSRRPMRVECGAVFTNSGFVSASAAIERIASIKKSHSSLDSDSVGSIIMAPGTISGNAVV